jgi:hypothetical protein
MTAVRACRDGGSKKATEDQYACQTRQCFHDVPFG